MPRPFDARALALARPRKHARPSVAAPLPAHGTCDRTRDAPPSPTGSPPPPSPLFQHARSVGAPEASFAGAGEAVDLGTLPPPFDDDFADAGDYEGLSRCKDILIVGPGELGARVASRWANRFPGARVVAQTRTANNHDKLRAMGIEGLELRVGAPGEAGEAGEGEGFDARADAPAAVGGLGVGGVGAVGGVDFGAGELSGGDGDDGGPAATSIPEGDLDGGVSALLEAQARVERFPYVVYCAPPSGAAAAGEDYAQSVYDACQLWEKSGGCVFTSSSAVYYGEDGALCTEDTPALPLGASERSDRLLRAEDACVDHGGCVVRLAGLYHATRGAHMYYLKAGEVRGRGDAMLNLIHYDDAADLVVEVLLNGGRCRRYMGVDGSPVSKEDVVDATISSGRFGELAPEGGVRFTTEGQGPMGRRMENPRTRQMLSWTPKHASFASFMERYGEGEVEL